MEDASLEVNRDLEQLRGERQAFFLRFVVGSAPDIVRDRYGLAKSYLSRIYIEAFLGSIEADIGIEGVGTWTVAGSGDRFGRIGVGQRDDLLRPRV